MKELHEFKTNAIWIKEYPIRYAGTRFNSRMTIIRLSNGNLFIHSPCAIDEHTKIAIEKLGEIEFIVAPGSYHYLYVGSAQSAFPNEEEQAFTIRTKINELVQLNAWGPYSSSRDQLVEMLDEAISGGTASDKN